jgi:hypothetical protein
MARRRHSLRNADAGPKRPSAAKPALILILTARLKLRPFKTKLNSSFSAACEAVPFPITIYETSPRRIHTLLGCLAPLVSRASFAPAPTNHGAIGCFSMLETWGVNEGSALVCK